MTANQHLHKNMLLRELTLHGASDNYTSLDEVIPNEAASDITLDNATKSSIENLRAREDNSLLCSSLRTRSLRAFSLHLQNPLSAQSRRRNSDALGF